MKPSQLDKSTNVTTTKPENMNQDFLDRVKHVLNMGKIGPGHQLIDLGDNKQTDKP